MLVDLVPGSGPFAWAGYQGDHSFARSKGENGGGGKPVGRTLLEDKSGWKNCGGLVGVGAGDG
jgi:hypothetical protein